VRLAVVNTAKEGNMSACRLFFQYLLGNPANNVADQEEKRRAQAEDAIHRAKELAACLSQLDVEPESEDPTDRLLGLTRENSDFDSVDIVDPPSVNGEKRKLTPKERKLRRQRARELRRNAPSVNGDSPPAPPNGPKSLVFDD
jgi:hypothetical protein